MHDDSLQSHWTGCHTAQQRFGRTGSTAPGEICALYTREVYDAMQDTLQPYMLRKALDHTVLGTLEIGEHPERFLSFALDPPLHTVKGISG